MKLGRETWLNGCAAVVLVIAGVWFVRNTEWVEVDVPVRPHGEAAKDPRYAMKRLFERLGARVGAPLNLDQLPPRGATLVLHSVDWNLFAHREQALRGWVEDGGKLLIASFQSPAWVPVQPQRAPSHRNATPVPPHEGDDVAHDDEPPARPAPARPMAAPRAIDDCQAAREGPGLRLAGAEPREFRLCNHQRFMALAANANTPVLWRLDGPDGTQLMTAGVGHGSVTVYLGALTDNAGLFQGDNAWALVTALDLRSSDTVWFVESESRTPLLKLLWQHGQPAVLLFGLLVGLVWWRQGVRFGPRAPTPPLARRSVAEQIRGTAHFILQRDASSLHRAQLRALEGMARRRIRDHDRLDRRTRAQAIAQATALDADDLARAMDPTLKRARRDLLATLALLETAVRRLSLNP